MNRTRNTYHTYNRRRHKSRPPHLSFLYGSIVVFLIIIIIFTRTPAQGLLSRALGPLGEIGQGISRIAILPFTSRLALMNENASLRAELAEAQAETQNYNALAAENAGFKEALGRSSPSTQTLAAIIARPPQLPYDTVMLDAGARAGIEPNDVVGSGSAALGIIIKAAGDSSQAILFSAPGQSTSAFLNDSIPVTLVGQGGGAFIAHVPRGTLAAIGDSAVLPNLSSAVIATVSHITNTSGNQIFKELYLTAPVSIFNLPAVEIWHEALPAAFSTSSSPQFPSTTKHGS